MILVYDSRDNKTKVYIGNYIFSYPYEDIPEIKIEADGNIIIVDAPGYHNIIDASKDEIYNEQVIITSRHTGTIYEYSSPMGVGVAYYFTEGEKENLIIISCAQNKQSCEIIMNKIFDKMIEEK